MHSDAFIAELWRYAEAAPMGAHPWFQGILSHRWSREQIILGEVQHYLRIRTNPIFFGYMAINAVADKNYELMQTVWKISWRNSGESEPMSISCSSFSKKAASPAKRRTAPSRLPERWPPLK
jgi:hypothetical protein